MTDALLTATSGTCCEMQLTVSKNSRCLNPMSELPKTDFLCASGSLLIGAGSIFNIAGSYFEYNTTEGDPDSRAIGADWKMVGQDIRAALDGFAKEAPSS